jgi:transcriptional regulator with PAS, ATPase and Fis domain
VIRSHDARLALRLTDSSPHASPTIAQMEKEAIRRALQATDGHRNDAAQRLGISVRTLQRKIKEYQL